MFIVNRPEKIWQRVFDGLGNPLFALLVKEVPIANDFALLLEAVKKGMTNVRCEWASGLPRRWLMYILRYVSVCSSKVLRVL